MANNINRIVMIGRLTKDPELRYTQGGTSVASFSLANNRSFTQQNEKKEQVFFFNCVAWGKTGETLSQYCKKGQRIAVEGRLQNRPWEDRSGQKRTTTEIVIDGFEFLSAKQEGEQSGNDDRKYTPPPAEEGPSHFSDEDIPF